MNIRRTGSRSLPVVAALRKLSVFGADQAGAYREHFAELAADLGADVQTRLAAFLGRWAGVGQVGVVLLTGNAGTGKTAAAEAYCARARRRFPPTDDVDRARRRRWVVKDRPGVSTAADRAAVLAEALRAGASGQALVCANEGMLRDALHGLAARRRGGDARGGAAHRRLRRRRRLRRQRQPAAADR